MPDFPIVDSHVHLWDPRHFRMSWLDGNDILDKTYDLAEYWQHTAGIDIAAMVYLQVEVHAAYALLEAAWVAERAKTDPRIKAIVAWAPLEDGDCARSFLDAMIKVTPLVKGIRRLIQGESLDFCVQPGFVAGVQSLPDFGMTFDLCITHQQLANTIKLVEQCPKVDFILDHIGKADIRAKLLDPWRQEIRELASHPNVLCKLSGMVTEAAFQTWTPDDLKPYVDHVIESFGEDRIVFGGDWPVAYQSSTYPRWVQTLDQLTAGLSAGARRKLWAENAARFYRFAL